jgi:hypothetical protein
MQDRVYYSPPFGPADILANAFFVAPALRRIFSSQPGDETAILCGFRLL